MGTTNPQQAPRRLANLKAVMVLSTTVSVVVAGLIFQSEAGDQSATACVCSPNTSYNNSLPASHPNNRCATQSQDLSWKSWLTGSSRTTQFHFLDLLELLHGHNSQPKAQRPTNVKPR